MARSKNYRRARAGVFLGAALLILWLLDLGGPSPKDGQREKNQAPTESDASKGLQGQKAAKKGEVEESSPKEEEVGGKAVGPVQEPPEDLIEGRRASIERMLQERDFSGARAWIAAESTSSSQQLREMAELYGSKLAGLGEVWESELRPRLARLAEEPSAFRDLGAMDDLERDVAAFARAFPVMSSGLFVDLPEGLGTVVTEEELAQWSQKLSRALPVELDAKRRLVRLAQGKAVLRVPGTAGGFRHEQADLVTLPPGQLLRLAPASEEKAARSFLARLYLAADRRVAATWLWSGKLALKPRAPGPGR